MSSKDNKPGDIKEITRYCSRCQVNYKHTAIFNGAWWVYSNDKWHHCGKFGEKIEEVQG